ncbi:MAG: c-type cytochrome [Acidobacteriota bacterium]|nr:c-type cytochrome [Acidobacteriota bacterium]
MKRIAPLVLLLLVVSGSCPAQEAQTAPPHVHPVNPRPTNLQVLPSDIAPDALHALMHSYSAQLGVGCNYCHAATATGKGLDFASDSKPQKQTARAMIRMTAAINEKYLATAFPDQKSPVADCGTCHRGHAEPEPFLAPPHEHEGH